MPFHIDKFRGSPEVQAMHPSARCGYIYLLASMWQSDDCTISSDPLDLATESGLGDELWAIHSPRILRKFELFEGKLRNAVLFSEWSEALKVYEKRKTGAVRTNSARSPHAVRTQSERPADTVTGTVTTTETNTKKQKPSRSRETPSRHAEFKDSFERYFAHRNPGLEAPWDEQEGAQLARFLKKNPKFTTEQWKALLQNRARSDVAHAESLSTWIARALTWASSPTKRGFNGKPSRIDKINDSDADTLQLLGSMGTPAYLGGRKVDTRGAAGLVLEGSHGADVARNR